MDKTILQVLGVAIVTGVLAAPAFGQEWAKARVEKSPRHLEWVKVKHGDREVNCFIAFPEVKEKATAVVVSFMPPQTPTRSVYEQT